MLAFLIFPMPATCPVHLILLDFITIIIYYKSKNYVAPFYGTAFCLWLCLNTINFLKKFIQQLKILCRGLTVERARFITVLTETNQIRAFSEATCTRFL
jgi:hypothetical protein